ncbi:nicotinamide riboside transporter PnuC [Tautonia rosea]|uniref:nicotinamide riboside transporter PnuC n=1 Tax=Tautonia rosea TaxID=2728037 RepID=UPI00147503A4|nr:nicotinamide riboside transporter PnuC [Tautonia rosea]
MTTIEAVAVLFGLLCVALTIRQSIWCWPTGLIQVSLFILIFYEVKLYSDLILHVVYVVLQVYGWHHWLHGGTNHQELAVSRLSVRGFLGWILITLTGTTVWGFGMASYTDAALPYGDAFTSVASLVAQWLMTRKRLESWLVWICVDIAAIGIYLIKSLVLTSSLYAVFLVMASIGFLSWRNTMVIRSKDPLPDEDRINSGQICPSSPGTSAVD